MTPDPGWLPFLKLLLGYLMMLTLAVLAGGFAHWAYGDSKEK